MPGRKFSSSNTYRFGFNGKENDNDVKGEGNQQDYGMRIYDPRISRFLSIDPLESEFAWNSPYSFAENDPINFIDLDGAEKARPSTVDLAKQLLAIVGKIIARNQTELSITTDETIKNNLLLSLELNKRTYKALAIFIYKNTPTTSERMGDILRKIEPEVNDFLDITPAGDIKVIFSGRNFNEQEKSRSGAIGWLALDIFGGEILSGLSKAGRSLRGITGPGKEALESVIKKVNSISTALDESHISAAVQDIFGNPIVINGKTYDHLSEVKNAITGLTNQIKNLNKIINNSQNGNDVIKAATELRNTLSNQKDEINAILDRATKSAAKKQP